MVCFLKLLHITVSGPVHPLPECYFSYAFFRVIISQVSCLYLSIHTQFVYTRNYKVTLFLTLTSLL